MSNHDIIKMGTLGFPWQTLDPFLFCVHRMKETLFTSFVLMKLHMDSKEQDGWEAPNSF